MKTRNFPERKRQRQAKSLARLSILPEKSDNVDYVSRKAEERAALEEAVTAGLRRGVFTKKRRANMP